MALYNLKSVYPLMESLYGIEDINPTLFEDLALNGWELIGNKHTRLYRYTGNVENLELQLPCNVDIIESVHIPIEDAQVSSSSSTYIQNNNIFTEHFIEKNKFLENPYYNQGKFVDYKEGNGVLYFKHNYKHVTVVYHGILVDNEEGLPLINDKEMKAIAAYVAYAYLFREGLRNKDQNSLSLSQSVQTEWLRKCNAARIPDHVSQNEMDQILDVKTRWDRKRYSFSYKPVL